MITVYIKDLVVEARHGWNPNEKNNDQRFKISAELLVEVTAVKTDHLEDTINWSGLRDQIVAITKNNSFNLVERLAQEIADQLLADTRVQKLTVQIDKLDAFPSGVPGVRLEASRR